ncbi:MAG: CoA pyrophosphatase [Coriobacteriia bacterium]|nr:CoA pyrophosphatase [Coriobacteriia bacterium]
MNALSENTIADIRERLERGLQHEREQRRGGAAIFIPLLQDEDGIEVLFQVRALDLVRQPGEVCVPGGHIEPGEAPRDAAIRETCEELLVDAKDVRIIADLGNVVGPGGMPLWVYAGTLDNYANTFDAKEVDRVFTVPLAWLQAHEPRVYRGEQAPVMPDDFPWDAIPQGRAYPWRRHSHEVTFYFGTEPLLWGFTARMVHRLVKLLG